MNETRREDQKISAPSLPEEVFLGSGGTV